MAPEADEPELLVLRPRGLPWMGGGWAWLLAVAVAWVALDLWIPFAPPLAPAGAATRRWQVVDGPRLQVDQVDAEGRVRLTIVGPSFGAPLAGLALLLVARAVTWRLTRYRVTSRRVLASLPLHATQGHIRTGRERVEAARGGLRVVEGARGLLLRGLTAADAPALEAALATPTAPVAPGDGPLTFVRPRDGRFRLLRAALWVAFLGLIVVLLLPGTAGNVLFREAWPLAGSRWDLSELGCLVAVFFLPSLFETFVRTRWSSCTFEGDAARFTIYSWVTRDLEERHPLASLVRLRETPAGVLAEVEGRSRWTSFWRPLLIPTRTDAEVAAVVARVEAARAAPPA